MKTSKTLLPALALGSLFVLGGCVTTVNNPPAPAENELLSVTELSALNSSWVECGADAASVLPVKEGVLSLEEGAGEALAPSTEVTISQMGEVSVVLKNNSQEHMNIGTGGYVALYLSDSEGKIVALPGGMPEPWVEFDLAGGESRPLSTTNFELCDGSLELKQDSYQAWGQINLSVREGNPGAEPTSFYLNGGPWSFALDD